MATTVLRLSTDKLVEFLGLNLVQIVKKFRIGHFTVEYLVAKPLIWSKAEVDHVVIETSL